MARRRRRLVWILVGVVAVLAAGAAAWGPLASRVEQARYTVAATEGAFEIREYAPAIVAETVTTGARRPAIEAGFRRLAGYIFGGNDGGQKVAMTAPVTQQAGERIAMTAPVTQQAADGTWRVRFTMPAAHGLDTLPAPRDPAVALRALPARRVAALRFSGSPDDDDLRRRADELARLVQARGLTPAGPATYAFYNPPWTLPFLRRNEVLVELAG